MISCCFSNVDKLKIEGTLNHKHFSSNFFVLRWHNRDWNMFILNDFLSDIYFLNIPLKMPPSEQKFIRWSSFIQKTSRRKRMHLPLDQHLANVLQQLFGGLHTFANFNTSCVSYKTFSSYNRIMEIMYVFSQERYLVEKNSD